MYPRRYNRWNKRSRKSLSKRKGYKAKRSSFASRVKRIIYKSTETKQNVQTIGPVTLNVIPTAGTAQFQSNCFNITPAIAQGVGASQRTGDKVNLTYARLKMHLNMVDNQSQAAVMGLTCRAIVFSIKDYSLSNSTPGTIPSVEVTNFFRYSTGSSGSFGNVLDILSPINTERFIVHHDKTFCLGSNAVPTAATTGYITGGTYYPSVKFLSMSVQKGIKRLCFDENSLSPTMPLNHNLWVAVLCQASDAGTTTSTTFTPLQFSFSMDAHYKDA